MNHLKGDGSAERRGGVSDLRSVCRAVISRIREEHPESSGYELFLRLWAACPSTAPEDLLQQVWFEEVMDAVGGVETIQPGPPLAIAGRGVPPSIQ